MGNFLGVLNVKSSNFAESREQTNIELITYLKTKTMKEVGETVELLRDYYPTN
jgi:hypothetical protein